MSTSVIPSVRYRDAHAGIAWLERALGFTRHVVYEGKNGTVDHAQLLFEGATGTGMIMLGTVNPDSIMAPYLVQPEEIGMRATGTVYLVVKDAEALYTKAKAADARIVNELETMSYGGKAFGCADPEGYFWGIGEYDPWAPHAG